MPKKKTEINPIRAERLKTAIKKLGISQKAFGEKIGVTQQYLSEIINCKKPLIEQKAFEIENTFHDFSAMWLLGFCDYPTMTKSKIENETEDYYRGYDRGKIEGRVEMRTEILRCLKDLVGSEVWDNI